MGVASKKILFGQKLALVAAQEPPVQRRQHKKVVFLMSSNNGAKKFGRCLQKMDFRPKNSIFGPH